MPNKVSGCFISPQPRNWNFIQQVNKSKEQLYNQNKVQLTGLKVILESTISFGFMCHPHCGAENRTPECAHVKTEVRATILIGPSVVSTGWWLHTAETFSHIISWASASQARCLQAMLWDLEQHIIASHRSTSQARALVAGFHCSLSITSSVLFWLIGGWVSWGSSTAETDTNTHTHRNGYVWRPLVACRLWVQCQAPSWASHRIKSSSVWWSWRTGFSHCSSSAPQTKPTVLFY